MISLIALGAVLAVVGSVASAKMQSERLDDQLCQTTGGGRFVGIPGFPGERIDRRLKRDVAVLVRRYKIYVTDGFSTDPVHSAKGEHPLGLALDIVPDASRGGRWRDIDRLAKWAEPRQNNPRAPFRWVGYDGDAGHGRGHHLHLSWAHSDKARFGKPARTVYTLRCPGASGGGGGGGGGETPPAVDPPKPDPGGGGIAPGEGKRKGKGKNKGKDKGGKKQSSGGVGYGRVQRQIQRQQRRGSRGERGGISLR